ncbi:MAG: ricin-type beta-trefoil lectin domain protein [Rhodospirillales bacterium]|nr:ricin-type beta-trefoil lectin domain protein [Rhodospirillales bacterium]
MPSSPAFALDDILLKSQLNGLRFDGCQRGQDIKAARCRTPFKVQRWSINPETSQIKHARRDLCQVVSNSNRENGARVVLWTCNHGTNQRWTIDNNGHIKSVLNDKCVDASKHNATTKLVNVHMWDCHGQNNQQWDRVFVKRIFECKRLKNYFIKKKN